MKCQKDKSALQCFNCLIQLTGEEYPAGLLCGIHDARVVGSVGISTKGILINGERKTGAQ